MSRWFGSKPKAHTSTMTGEEEDKHLLDVENALLHLLNDDIAAADKILKQQDSSYHHLGRGISGFINAMLGVEKELLKDAANMLAAAEAKTWDDMKKAEKEPTAYRSRIYPPGTEYLLCYAISQLTSAICAVLSGSVTEAIKGFYKLRKAYITLDGIMDIESKYLKNRVGSRTSSLTSQTKPPSTAHSATARTSKDLGADGVILEKKNGSIKDPEAPDNAAGGLTEPEIPLTATTVQSKLLDIDPASVGITSHTDIFIHSGTRLCYGILLVVFSMIENPLFTKILYIVGFKGDRERGTRYLWQAARFENFNSAIAGIALLGYYNGLVGFCDILPTDAGSDDDLSGYPRGKCRVLLADMRARYPESKLWKMEEARMQGYDRNLAGASKILAANSDSNMKQIATINMFELGLTTLFLHDYEFSAKSWEKCAELSQWSPTMYAYMTGCCFLELYRNLRASDPEAAAIHKKKSTDYIRKAPPLAGRQKVMAKELPFDLYITRKVAKWEERAKAWDVDLVDAIGVSPLTEMVYFWGGGKKENQEQLQKSLDAVQWARTSHPEKFEQDLDETAIKAVIEASMLRHMGKYEESRPILEKEVLNHDRTEFRGHLKDDWMLPSAHYEMACLAWFQKDLPGADSKAAVLECEQWLEKTQKWDQYVLDTRVSVKLTTSLITVRRHKGIMGW
ncbi:Mitochondrial outer membrane protein iml2 [Lachnellula suecica]|uniref:Inclusion body clearance protein IML2 n=1 Tax=Lachnellula suecica TaxID=602035 RepID=A0A8T9C8F7_9HELO|nr:Mitochondrial outer membrane protein iml2 [Lachnellula suecica]